VIILISVPVMLLTKPIIMHLQNKRAHKLREQRGGDHELADKVAYRKFIEEKVALAVMT
jgi:hypothetical protein